MAVQWTVSFSKSALDERGLEILKSYEHVEFERQGNLDIDMAEEEFFPFAEEMEQAGLSLPTDGSDSWGKHV